MKIVDCFVFGLLVVSILSWEALRAEEYVIIQRKRSINTGTTLEAQPDRFTIPSSLCLGDGSEQCKEMHASRISNCTCKCNRTTNGDFSFSTFGLDRSGRWTCLENAEVHERLGCSVILNNWANDSSLMTAPNVGIARYEIPMQFRNFYMYPNSKTQTCDGKWKYLNRNLLLERFSVLKTENKQYLKFNYSGNPASTAMTGRVIKLGGVYYKDPGNKIVRTCILLKIQGEIQCPFSLPTTTTPSTTDPSVLSTSTKNTLSTSTRSITHPKTYITSSSSHTVTMPTGKTSAPMVVKTNAQNTSFDDHTTGMIAGAVAGVIGLIAVVIVMVLVRRRKKRKTTEKRKDVAAENIGYGTNRAQQSLEDQEEYSYAYASALSINKRDQQPRSKGAQSAENVNNSMNRSVADFPVNMDHILKNPEYATVNKASGKGTTNEHHEPLYRVLEGPETKGADAKEPPCYHVLEGPYLDSGLEEPKSSAPFPNQGNTRQMPNVKPEVEGNRGYTDTVYDSVEEIIADTGDIYQHLNRDGQREPGVYQALTYGNQAMPLTKLNASHSEA